MRILFCGTSVPEKIEYQIEQISAAGNRFQNNMISNLRAMGHEVMVLSYIAMPITPEVENELCNTEDQMYVVRKTSGFSDTFNAVKACRKQAKELLNSCDVMIAYNVFYNFLFLPDLVKKSAKKSVLVLADYSGKECYKSIIGKVYALLQQHTMKKYDTVVGLSANIQKVLLPKQKFVLMEGGIDQKFYDGFSYKPREMDKVVRFMYSGLLSKVTGVDLLLEAISKVPDHNIELWISGKGELESEVRTSSAKDARIKYLGHMEYSEYMKCLQEADVLINPRNMLLPENQNNFPSKIMEYLAVGKPILSSKFVGWEKFQNEIYFYDANLKEALHAMCCKIEGQEVCFEEVYECNRKRAKAYLWGEQLRKVL